MMRRLALLAALLASLPSAAAAYLQTQTCYTFDMLYPCDAARPHCEGDVAVRPTQGRTAADLAECDSLRGEPPCAEAPSHCEGNSVVAYGSGSYPGADDTCRWFDTACSSEDRADGCCEASTLECTYARVETPCGAGSVCRRGACVTAEPCTEGAPCTVDAADAYCKEGNTGVVVSDGGTCVGGVCVPSETTNPCDAGLVCRRGSCVAPGCGRPTDDNVCCPVESAICSYDWERDDCGARGLACVDGACGPPVGCATADVCVDPPPAWCDENTRVFYDASGACSDRNCTYAERRAECPAGSICRDGACTAAGFPANLTRCADDEEPVGVRWPTACVGFHFNPRPLEARSPMGSCNGEVFEIPDDGRRAERGWRRCGGDTVSFDCAQCGTGQVCVPDACADPVDCSTDVCSRTRPRTTCDGDVQVTLTPTGVCSDRRCEVDESRVDCAAAGRWCLLGACVVPTLTEPTDVVEREIVEGFDAWNAVDSSGFEATLLGRTDETEIGAAVDAEGNLLNGVNLIIVQTEVWNHSSIALGVTTPVFRADNGQIVDADMEINAASGLRDEVRRLWAADATPGGTYIDLQNVVTHEAGHFLGLDHPPCFIDASNPPACVEATMYASSGPGDTVKRDLAADDIEAVSTLYPAAAAAPSCEPANRGFYHAATRSTEPPTPGGAACSDPDYFCGGEPEPQPHDRDDDGCSAVGTGGVHLTAWLPLLALLRRRRRVP